MCSEDCPNGKSSKGDEEESMNDWKSLSHVKWDCKYHLVFISRYRQRKIYGEVRGE